MAGKKKSIVWGYFTGVNENTANCDTIYEGWLIATMETPQERELQDAKETKRGGGKPLIQTQTPFFHQS